MPQDRIDTGDLPDASLEVDVPMADYSGHEDMWAAATAILDEIDEPAPVAVPTPVAAPQPAAPAYVGRHSAVFPEDTARISRESIERAEAIAAGIMENRRHERVNQILEEGDRAPAVLYRQAYGPCLSERYRGRYRQLRAAPRGGITSAWLRSIENGGRDLPDGALDLGQFAGSRLGVGSLSLTVMEAIRGFLHSVGLPYEWVTNFVVRKCCAFYRVYGARHPGNARF